MKCTEYRNSKQARKTHRPHMHGGHSPRPAAGHWVQVGRTEHFRVCPHAEVLMRSQSASVRVSGWQAPSVWPASWPHTEGESRSHSCRHRANQPFCKQPRPNKGVWHSQPTLRTGNLIGMICLNKQPLGPTSDSHLCDNPCFWSLRFLPGPSSQDVSHTPPRMESQRRCKADVLPHRSAAHSTYRSPCSCRER